MQNSVAGRYPWQASEAGEASTSGRTSEASEPPVAEVWKRDGNEALPAWAATQPSIIWLPIQAGERQDESVAAELDHKSKVP